MSKKSRHKSRSGPTSFESMNIDDIVTLLEQLKSNKMSNGNQMNRNMNPMNNMPNMNMRPMPNNNQAPPINNMDQPQNNNNMGNPQNNNNNMQDISALLSMMNGNNNGAMDGSNMPQMPNMSGMSQMPNMSGMPQMPNMNGLGSMFGLPSLPNMMQNKQDQPQKSNEEKNQAMEELFQAILKKLDVLENNIAKSSKPQIKQVEVVKTANGESNTMASNNNTIKKEE